MIYGKLDNIAQYSLIPQKAVEFLSSNTKIECGKYVLSDDLYINVEEYRTKNLSDVRFESHKDYIDVQIILSGREDLYYTGIDNLSVSIPYEKNKDIMFYKDDVSKYNKVTLDGTNFVVLAPEDAHAPQAACEGNLLLVKKAVIKIKI